MRISEKRLVIINIICVAIIATALALRFSSITQSPSAIIDSNIPPDTAETTSPDPAFYGAGKLTTKATTTVASPVAAAKPEVPEITAEAYLVGNVETGKIYLERNVSKVLPVASMSKLVTAIAATDTLLPDSEITITDEEYNVASDTSMIGPGETFTMKELLYPLLLNSSNVAAEALASTSNRAKFLELMTSYSWEIGMPSTFFADPSGINPRNQSTASDFFALARYLYKYRPDILAITRIPDVTVSTTSDHAAHDFRSIQPFVSDPAFLGGKTGHTSEAGDTMLTIMNIMGQPIAIVILGADSGSRESDTRMLMAKLDGLLK